MSRAPLALPAPAANGARRMRIVATGLLVLMAGIFFLARSQESVHPAWGFVRAFAEAAMVGGLADWFAVTALFRHPLGLPIPHTAIIPRNKDRIGDTLANFLKNNFLIPGVVARRMKRVDVAGAVGRFLAAPPEGEGRIRESGTRLVADVMEALDPERLGGMVKGAIDARLRGIDFAPLLGQALQAAIRKDRHIPVLEGAIRWAARTLDANEHLIRQMVHDRAGSIMRWTGLDETLADKIIDGLLKLLDDMAVDAGHPVRMKAEDALARLAEDLQFDPVMQHRVADLRDELLANDAMRRWIDGLWESARAACFALRATRVRQWAGSSARRSANWAKRCSRTKGCAPPSTASPDAPSSAFRRTTAPMSSGWSATRSAPGTPARSRSASRTRSAVTFNISASTARWSAGWWASQSMRSTFGLKPIFRGLRVIRASARYPAGAIRIPPFANACLAPPARRRSRARQ